mmetsp:Transcript_9768/g.9552  ORF Transcript_9768/g.9552 Transcript_9768/m.9552 type:complete len:106 (-) Transcript_9768:147-464(-)
MLLQEVSISVTSAEVAQDCYVKYNSSFDKDPMMKYAMEPLMGDSTLFEASTETWAHKRKALGSAFYKNKLIKMLEIVKVILNEKLDEWEREYVSKDKAFDLMAEI